MENYLICVPSRNRAAWLETRKFHTLKVTSHLAPHLVVRPDDPQLDDYRELSLAYGAPLIKQKMPALGAGQAYDFCIEHAIEEKAEWLYILNDDSGLQAHDILRFPDIKFTHCSREVISRMFDNITRVLNYDCPAATFVSMMRRGHMIRGRLAFCKPLMGAYLLYVPFFREHPEFRFWVGTHKAEAYCDYNLTLRLLTSGYLTTYFTPLLIDTALNNPGGCSDYRTLTLEEEGMRYILEHFPKFTRPSVAKNWGGGIERESATIQWIKAFDRALFIEHFGQTPDTITEEMETEQQVLYARLIEDVQSKKIPMSWEE